jgi:ribosome-binding ATPase YchF (GTP1/OBG family)
VHVVRCFSDANIAHVIGAIDPVSDISTIENELIFYDLIKIESRQSSLAKKNKSGQNAALQNESLFLNDLSSHLSSGLLVNSYPSFRENIDYIKGLFLLTSKPVIYVCNMDEQDIVNKGNHYTAMVSNKFGSERVMNICAFISLNCLVIWRCSKNAGPPFFIQN